MSVKTFIKSFLVSLGVQIILLVVVSPLVSRQFANGKIFPLFLINVVYDPFIMAVIRFGGYTGEASMIWPPVFGIVVGIFVYSALFATAVTLMSYYLRGRKLSR